MKLNLDPKSTVLVDGKNYLSVMDKFVFTEGVLNITVLSYVWSNTKQKGSDQDNQQLKIIPRKRSVFLFGVRFKLILNRTFFCSKHQNTLFCSLNSKQQSFNVLLLTSFLELAPVGSMFY